MQYPFLLLLLLSLALLLIRFLVRWLRPNPKLSLPPGSLGWPYIGETFKLYTQDPNSFFSDRQKRYGNVFKTHVLGCPCVMVSSPEAAKLVLVTQAHLFKPTYPPSKEKLIGPRAIFFHQGEYHHNLKKLIQASFLPSAIRSTVSEIEKIVTTLLVTWDNTTINTLLEMKRFSFDVAMLSVFGPDQQPEKGDIKRLYQCLEKGYNSMPFNLKGTSYNKALQARKLLDEILRGVIEKRKGGKCGGGLLDVLLGCTNEKNSHLTESQVADNVIGVLFAAHDTTATVLTWIIKYLCDERGLLESVTREQEEIQKEARGLTWEDTRRMPMTNLVIQETLRMASILSFTFREAVEDVELEGYIIPKGWKVLPLFRSIHHCADFFPHPEKFDPYRFKFPPKPNTYMPFGSGVHSCPGNQLAKLEMLVFLHHLTTKYRWKKIGASDGVEYRPFPVPKHGLPLLMTRRMASRDMKLE